MKISKQLLSFSLLFAIGCQPKGVLFENALCIENISIIDPEVGLIPDQTVIIKDGKIFKVSPSVELKLASENTIVDGKGKFLIPGLWDAHVHFAYIEALAPSMFDLFLGYGITSVRDTGGRMEFVKNWKDRALANPTEAPRVMIAGPLLDGHPNVYDGSDADHPPLSVDLSSVEEVTQKVNELDSLGVDLLKAYEMLSPEQFMKITQLGKEKGLKVTGHVPLSMNVISASNAGLNSMEHMRNLELSCASNSEELFNERQNVLAQDLGETGSQRRTKIHDLQRKSAVENYDEHKADEVLKVLAKNQTWQIPTMALNTMLTEQYFTKEDWKKSLAYLPEAIESEWKKGIAMVRDRELSEFDLQYTQWKLKMVGKMHQAKIELMAGTDCPIFFLTPGLSLHEELAVLVRSGLTPLEALKTATFNPAKYFNLEDELGSIKENRWADMVILDANPLENIEHTKQINAVIKQGKLMDRATLDKLLKSAGKQVK